MENKQKIRKKIRKLWEGVSPESKNAGAYWYKYANIWSKLVAERLEIDYRTVAAVCAVLSPAVKWSDNKIQTDKLIHAYLILSDVNGIVITTYKTQLKKALQILDHQDPDTYEEVIGPRAFKTVAFYNNIKNPAAWQYVTIDRHILSALDITVTQGLKSHYRTVEECFVYVAAQLGIKPHALQAGIWLQHKENQDIAPF